MKFLVAFAAIVVLSTVASAEISLLSPRGDMLLKKLVDPLPIPIIISNSGNLTEYASISMTTNGSAQISLSTFCDTPSGRVNNCVTVPSAKTARIEAKIRGYQLGDVFRISVRGRENRESVRFQILKVEAPTEDGNETVIVYKNDVVTTTNDIVPPPINDNGGKLIIENETLLPVYVTPKKNEEDITMTLLIVLMISVVVIITIVVLRFGTKEKTAAEIRALMEKKLRKTHEGKIEVRMFTQTGDGWESIVMISGRPYRIRIDYRGEITSEQALSNKVWVA